MNERFPHRTPGQAISVRQENRKADALGRLDRLVSNPRLLLGQSPLGLAPVAVDEDAIWIRITSTDNGSPARYGGQQVIQANNAASGDAEFGPTGTSAAQQVLGVLVGYGGTGYDNTATVTFEGGGGTGATGTPVVSNGIITGVTMTSPGSGYTSAPAVIFSQPTGTPADGWVNFVDGLTLDGANLYARELNNNAVPANGSLIVKAWWDTSGQFLWFSGSMGSVLSTRHLSFLSVVRAQPPNTNDLFYPAVINEDNISNASLTGGQPMGTATAPPATVAVFMGSPPAAPGPVTIDFTHSTIFASGAPIVGFSGFPLKVGDWVFVRGITSPGAINCELVKITATNKAVTSLTFTLQNVYTQDPITNIGLEVIWPAAWMEAMNFPSGYFLQSVMPLPGTQLVPSGDVYRYFTNGLPSSFATGLSYGSQYWGRTYASRTAGQPQLSPADLYLTPFIQAPGGVFFNFQVTLNASGTQTAISFSLLGPIQPASDVFNANAYGIYNSMGNITDIRAPVDGWYAVTLLLGNPSSSFTTVSGLMTITIPAAASTILDTRLVTNPSGVVLLPVAITAVGYWNAGESFSPNITGAGLASASGNTMTGSITIKGLGLQPSPS